MKLPMTGRVISIYGYQKDARVLEENVSTGGKQVHAIDPEVDGRVHHDKETTEEQGHVEPLGHTRVVQLFSDDPTKHVIIGKDLYLRQQGSC